jgi:ribonuclease HI
MSPLNRRPARSRPRPPDMPTPPGAIEVYTDGACSGNPGPGGWAWVVDDGRSAAGSEPVTTNQRMEIRAALEAIQALPGPLVVVSDSTYVVNCFRDSWWRGWRTRGWTNTARKPVANRDLWEPLVDLVEARGDVAFRWVKGHSGNRLNDLADELAVAAGLTQARVQATGRGTRS